MAKTDAGPGPARWQVPEIDAAALALARRVREAVDVLSAAGRRRWVGVLEPQIAPLADGDLAALEQAARRVRAAFGVGESVAEHLATQDAIALRDAADAVLRALDREAAGDTLTGRRSRRTKRSPLR